MREVVEKAVAYLQRRRRAYITSFAGPVGALVLADLARFCRANESTFHPDERPHLLLEGRREVWLRIQQHLNLTDNELAAIYRLPTE